MSLVQGLSTRRWFAHSSSTATSLASVSSTTPTAEATIHCSKITLSYNIVVSVFCGVYFVFGILYCFFGYRFFKATMFLTGFTFGGLVTYVICSEEEFLQWEVVQAGVSLTVGVLCGLITMLVQYVGLFLTGFHLGLLLAIASLVIMEQFHHPHTGWISIGLLFGVGLLFSLLTLKFQKCLTIAGTSAFGAAIMVMSLDYFVEMFTVVEYVWNRIKAEHLEELCWFSWLMLLLWPVTFIVGIVVQCRVTSKGCDHHEVVHVGRRRRSVNLQKPRGTTTHSNTGDRREFQQSRYRHLYQVRRVNGDVISTNYVQNIRHKLSPAVQNLVPPGSSDHHISTAQTVLTQIPC